MSDTGSLVTLCLSPEEADALARHLNDGALLQAPSGRSGGTRVLTALGRVGLKLREAR